MCRLLAHVSRRPLTVAEAVGRERESVEFAAAMLGLTIELENCHPLLRPGTLELHIDALDGVPVPSYDYSERT
jgi:hypothetical protein